MHVRARVVEGALLILVTSGCGGGGPARSSPSDDGGPGWEGATGAVALPVLAGEGGTGCSEDRPVTGCVCHEAGKSVACPHGGTRTCAGAGEFSQWGPCIPQQCEPSTCASVGAGCGSVPDGCGGTLSCGSCAAPQSCGGGGVGNQCGCTPSTCAALGANCGSVSDGCGGTLDCGSCSAPQSCGGGGTANQCGGCTGCYPGAVVWCPGAYAYCYAGDDWDYQATETCQPDGTWGPCTEGGSAPGNCGDGNSVGAGWVGDCSGAICP